MAIEKYRYYLTIDLVNWIEIHPVNNTLQLTYKVNDEWDAVVDTTLEGSFGLFGDEFDLLINSETNQFRIYENGDIDTGTLVFSGYISKFNEPDYRKRYIEVKDFITFDKYLVFNGSLNADREYYIYGSSLDLIWDGSTIATASKGFESMLESMGGITYTIDIDNIWYGTPAIDLKKLRIVDLKDVTWTDIETPNTSQRKKITHKWLLKLIEVLFRGYWYIDDDLNFKFKTPADLVTNVLNAEGNLIYKRKKRYDLNKKFDFEVIKFNKNNQPNAPESNGAWDEAIGRINYTGNSKSKLEYDLAEICTKFDAALTEYNLDGFLLCYVNNGTNEVESENQVGTSTPVINGKLSAMNLMAAYYQDYIWTNKDDFSYSGIAAGSAPTHFRPFIQLDDYQTILPSIATFYDGIRYELSGTDERIARVMSQSTNLNTNITTFKLTEFVNEID